MFCSYRSATLCSIRCWKITKNDSEIFKRFCAKNYFWKAWITWYRWSPECGFPSFVNKNTRLLPNWICLKNEDADWFWDSQKITIFKRFCDHSPPPTRIFKLRNNQKISKTLRLGGLHCTEPECLVISTPFVPAEFFHKLLVNIIWKKHRARLRFHIFQKIYKSFVKKLLSSYVHCIPLHLVSKI